MDNYCCIKLLKYIVSKYQYDPYPHREYQKQSNKFKIKTLTSVMVVRICVRNLKLFGNVDLEEEEIGCDTICKKLLSGRGACAEI